MLPLWKHDSYTADMDIPKVKERHARQRAKALKQLSSVSESVLDIIRSGWASNPTVDYPQLAPSPGTVATALDMQPEQLAQSLNQMTFPDPWSRWMCFNDFADISAYYDERPTGNKWVTVSKLHPTIYGSDAQHDLGLCTLHFTHGDGCQLYWTMCPLRHWMIESLEGHWIDTNWLQMVMNMNRGPKTTLDAPAAQYDGLARTTRFGEAYRGSKSSEHRMSTLQRIEDSFVMWKDGRAVEQMHRELKVPDLLD